MISIFNICLQPPQTDTSAATTTTKTDQDEVDEAPPSKQSEKATEELLHQKEKLEHERVCILLK